MTTPDPSALYTESQGYVLEATQGFESGENEFSLQSIPVAVFAGRLIFPQAEYSQLSDLTGTSPGSRYTLFDQVEVIPAWGINIFVTNGENGTEFFGGPNPGNVSPGPGLNDGPSAGGRAPGPTETRSSPTLQRSRCHE